MKRREIRIRLIHVVEALEVGDTAMAASRVQDLLDDLDPRRGRSAGPSSSCPECGLQMWPGQLAQHRSVVHDVDVYGEAA